MLLVATSCGGGQLSSDLLGSNGDNGRLVSMGVGYPEGGVVSFSYPLVWNRSDRPLTLTNATVADQLGEFEVLGTRVGDGARKGWAVDAYRSFPEDHSGVFPAGSIHELDGYVLQPVEATDLLPDRSESTSIIVGLKIDPDDLPIAVLGVCVQFSDATGATGEECVKHSLTVCECTDDCPLGAELDELVHSREE
jgi:hypothetical protein